MDPTKKITIVYAHQCVPNQEGYVHPRIRNIVYGALQTSFKRLGDRTVSRSRPGFSCRTGEQGCCFPRLMVYWSKLRTTRKRLCSDKDKGGNAMYTSSMTPEKALAGFGSVDCAQHVFGEFAPQLGVDREISLKISAYFGGGMWEGATCGAVVGALMSIGLKYGQGDSPDPEKKNLMLQKGAEFKARFAEKYGSCLCKEMLGYKIPEEMEQIMAENKFGNVCCHAVTEACRICSEILNEE